MTGKPPWVPQLFLDARRRRFVVRLGGAELQPDKATTSNALGGRPRAEFDLSWRDRPPVDFLGPLTVTALERAPAATTERPLFTGLVDAVTVEDDALRAIALGATELAEGTLGRLSSGVSAVELVHLMARSAGLGDERLRIEGLDQLPHEVVQVIAPVDGASVDSPERRGDVQFTADRRVAASFATMGDDDAPLYAVTYVEASRLHDAEQRGLATINAALDLLLAACAYGLSTRPGGMPVPFTRTTARARPALRRTVFVQGVSTRRWWCRDRTVSATAAGADVAALLSAWPELPRPISPALAHGLAALRVAADALAGTVERVQALWNAIEFYAAGAKVPKLFDRSARTQLAAAVSATSLTEEQKTRAREVLGGVNTPPLLVRLKAQAAADGVPVTASELDMLVQLRGRRNDSAHGRAGSSVSGERLDWAVSVAARLFLYRHVRKSSGG